MVAPVWPPLGGQDGGEHSGTRSENSEESWGSRLFRTEEVEMAVREWLQKQEPDFYGEGILQLVPR